jgi:hypothetical protein
VVAAMRGGDLTGASSIATDIVNPPSSATAETRGGASRAQPDMSTKGYGVADVVRGMREGRSFEDIWSPLIDEYGGQIRGNDALNAAAREAGIGGVSSGTSGGPSSTSGQQPLATARPSLDYEYATQDQGWFTPEQRKAMGLELYDKWAGGTAEAPLANRRRRLQGMLEAFAGGWGLGGADPVGAATARAVASGGQKLEAALAKPEEERLARMQRTMKLLSDEMDYRNKASMVSSRAAMPSAVLWDHDNDPTTPPKRMPYNPEYGRRQAKDIFGETPEEKAAREAGIARDQAGIAESQARKEYWEQRGAEGVGGSSSSAAETTRRQQMQWKRQFLADAISRDIAANGENSQFWGMSPGEQMAWVEAQVQAGQGNTVTGESPFAENEQNIASIRQPRRGP